MADDVDNSYTMFADSSHGTGVVEKSIKEKNQIIVGMKNRMFQEGLMMESITFNDWIQEIMKL